MNEQTYDPEQPLWSIMTKSRGGTVSVVQDLTLEQVRRTYERLDPWYGMHSKCYPVHKDFMDGPGQSVLLGGPGRRSEDGDIEIREVFGPPGWHGFSDGEIQRWPIQIDVYIDRDGNILPDEYQEDIEAAETERMFRAMMNGVSAD
jgi:hypothetical protein